MLSVETDGEAVDKIDLYNFEDPKFENSRYVLTSPRSLEACSRLNVKPVELLYKPLTEFQEELLPQDVPLRTIYNIYDEQEQIRLRKLHLCREERGRINKDEVQEISAQSQKQSKKSDKAGSRNLTKASLQRHRTALASGAGHKRVTKDELNKRAKELEDESIKLRQELLSRKEGKPKKPASASRRPRSARGGVRGENSSSTGRPARSKSASDVYSKLPPRDRKILDLMRSKREAERQQQEESERSRQLWEEEKQRQEALRAVMENKRRKLLAKEDLTKRSQHLRESLRRDQMEEKDRDEKEDKLMLRSKLSDDSLYKQLTTQALKLSARKEKGRMKKSIQERNLDVMSRDEEDMKRRVAELTQSSVAQAQRRKEMGMFQQSLRKSMSNHQERLAFEQRRRELEKDSRKQEQGAMTTMELRHSQADQNLASLMETRTQQLIASHEEEEKRLSKARETQQKMEEEMEAWRRKLLKHQKQVERRAEVTVQVNKESRAQRARQERLAHQQEQRKNLHKLNKEHEQWKRSLEMSMHEKDRKIVEIQQEREKFISQTRSVAQLSQLLRDKVRMKYQHDTFDRKALDAQLFARLENTPPARRLPASSST
ncbi:uncharacterized protein LOC143281907 isoform X1 [Babylonia areolata]|uniref:uncharacterized protein LOC143281907 isoform X1 n=1 Tax=Babylonia areolata TaxID=304850 RepID=UPI003FD193B7